MQYRISGNPRSGKAVVHYACPHCGCQLKSKLKEAGGTDNCPDCGRAFRVPGSREKQQAEASAAAVDVPADPQEVAAVQTPATAPRGEEAHFEVSESTTQRDANLDVAFLNDLQTDPQPSQKQKQGAQALDFAAEEPAARGFRRSHAKRICWWLRFYAKVNFCLSCLVAGGALLVAGLAVVGASAASNIATAAGNQGQALAGLFSGAGVFAGFLYLVWAVLAFMWMNIFTLACAWAAEMLELQEQTAKG